MAGTTRNINCLREPFRGLILKLLGECQKQNISIIITETCRTKKVQEAYYAQGRKSLEEVNKLRREAGLPSISEKENRQPITWTTESAHMYGVAIDFVPLKNGKADWNDVELFKKVGQIAINLGLEWGGNWKVKDYPHIELKGWRNMKEQEKWNPWEG